MASFPASKLEPEPLDSATCRVPASTRRAAFGISGLGSIRRPWTFPAKSASIQPRTGQSSGLLQGLTLCQSTKAFFTFSPLSSRWFACIYITKGEFSRDSFLNKENLFQGEVYYLLKPRRREQFLALLNRCVWLAFLQFSTVSTLLAVFFFFVFGQN